MRRVDSKAKSVRELLQGVKYSIDYYQREYLWEAKQVQELLDDMANAFLEAYTPGIQRREVRNFPHYFLGAINISHKNNESFIVDGQQRLTTLTLLLILLRNLQKGRDDAVNIDDLIFSERYGERTFNLDVDERAECMEALYEGASYDTTGKSESVQNLYQRYQDMEDGFPYDDLTAEALPYFVDWLIENVALVEITAYSDEDAYTIFETMNDRGLRLSPTDMLKGYLLANMDHNDRIPANDLWRSRIQKLTTAGDDHGADFFKTWLRSQYSMKTRDRRRGAKNEDFELIGTEFHRWLRNAKDSIGLSDSQTFFQFVERNFDFYSTQYIYIRSAKAEMPEGLKYIHFNYDHGFTLQELLLLAPLQPGDSDNTIQLKLQTVAQFVDILITRRIWNFRSIAYSTMLYTMSLVMRDIRRLDPDDLAARLHQTLSRESETFGSNERLRLHQQNRYALHRLLARITDYVETQSGHPSRYREYVGPRRDRYEVEHIWSNHSERHREFTHPADFAEYRNRIGGLLLLPKSFNASYGALPYEDKLPHYNTSQNNLLARSLHPQAYVHNPGFIQFKNQSGIPFRSYEHFERADLEERSKLYRLLAERIWDPDALFRSPA